MDAVLALVATSVAPKAAVLDLNGMTSHPLSLIALLSVMALAPFAAVMLTSFSKIAVVLSMARSAMGTQQAPPTLVLTGLALVLTAHIMAPVLERMQTTGEKVLKEAGSGAQLLSAVGQVGQPLRDFLVRHGSPEERARFAEWARELRPPEEAALVREEDLAIVVPAFVVTELKEAFLLGFLVFLPFLVLDMVVANILLALGMQSLSPTQVSLPFKVLLFVSVDGWSLLSRGLILGYR